MAVPDATREEILRDCRSLRGPVATPPTTSGTVRPPLGDVVVVDFSERIRGAFVAKQLADAGARVIVVERPEGSPLRAVGAAHDALRRGMESVALDLGEASSRALVDRLILSADVVIDDSDPGDPRREGHMAYDRARSRAEGGRKLIFCALSTFGEAGPYAGRVATELELQGMAGYQQFLGTPDTPPLRIGLDLSSVGAAMFAVAGVLAALYERRTSGLGQRVWVSELAALLAYCTYWLGPMESADEYAGLMMTAPEDPPVRGYKTADRPLMLSMLTGSIERGQRAWETLSVDLGLESLNDDPFWADIGPRLIGWGREAERTRATLEAAFATRYSDELLWTISRAGAIAGVVNSYRMLFSGEHPHVEALGILPRDGQGNLVLSTAAPWSFDGARFAIAGSAPLLGADTAAVRDEFLRYESSPEQVIS
jgi:crotonobetainyl-CoA:carnitine CoA-transferase CaiB-like acyl-CoA transferase